MNYILNEQGEPVPEPDIQKWAHWFQKADRVRVVKHDTIGKVTISTVFLGLDHNYYGKGNPVLWETMTFGDGEELQERCSGSREQAEAMHAHMVQMVKDRK